MPLSFVEYLNIMALEILDFAKVFNLLLKWLWGPLLGVTFWRLYCRETKNYEIVREEYLSRTDITTYMWTSSNEKKDFMAITTNWIDDSWLFKSNIKVIKVFFFFCIIYLLYFLFYMQQSQKYLKWSALVLCLLMSFSLDIVFWHAYKIINLLIWCWCVILLHGLGYKGILFLLLSNSESEVVYSSKLYSAFQLAICLR